MQTGMMTSPGVASSCLMPRGPLGGNHFADPSAFSLGMNGVLTHEEMSSSESREEEYESRSVVDNMDGSLRVGAGGMGIGSQPQCQGGNGVGGFDEEEEEEEEEEEAPPSKKKKAYHRHTPSQIQELEMFFKENHHPDEAARQELSRRLNLTPRQVKFWFQNRRTQSKCRLERLENSMLRQENERLRAENIAMREAIRHASCPACGGPSSIDMSMDEPQLRLENSRMRDELERLYALGGGKLCSSAARSFSPLPFALTSGNSTSPPPDLSSLPLSRPLQPPVSSSSLDRSSSISSTMILNSAVAASDPMARWSSSCPHTEAEKALIIDAAMAAMDEFLQLNRPSSPMENPLWVASSSASSVHVESLDYHEYACRFPKAAASKPPGFRSEASRALGTVMMNALSIVEVFLDVNHWMEMFPCLMTRADVGEVIASGSNITRNGALQTMHAELQVLSPLVPTREIYFVRFCKHIHENVWAVVDFSIDMQRGDSLYANKCRRRPSGCLIQEMPNGYSEVSWVEHWEYDDRCLHHLYQSLITNGMAFGALRWLATMQRQCERMVSLMASNIATTAGAAGCLTLEGRRSMLKLAQRMTISFCSSVSASPSYNWTTLSGGGKDQDEVRVMTRKSIDSINDPNGIVLNAATSIWLPVEPQRLFRFLRNENLRKEWDVLSMGGPMVEAVHIAKGRDPGNCVSVLKAQNAVPNNMLILQECCTDSSGSLVVYAPVDVPNINAVMSGGDPSLVTILPSGFAILPDGSECRPISEGGETGAERPSAGGSLLTVAFQILVNSMPGSKFTIESVGTVNSLVSNTVKQIKQALSCEDV